MTKKDYELIASVFNKTHKHIKTKRDRYDADGHTKLAIKYNDYAQAVYGIQDELATAFLNDNSKFNKRKFYDACEL